MGFEVSDIEGIIPQRKKYYYDKLVESGVPLPYDWMTSDYETLYYRLVNKGVINESTSGGGGGGGVSVTAKSRPAKSWLKYYMINAVQSPTNMVIGGSVGAGSTLEDTSDFAVGSKCVKLVSNGAGGQGHVTLSGLTLDMTGKGLLLWLKVESTSINNLAYIAVDLGTTTINNRVRGFAMDPNGMLTLDDWVAVPIPWANFAEGAGGAGTPDRANVNVIRVTIADKNGVPVTVKVGGFAAYIESGRYPGGVISFTFDDSFKSTFDVGFAKLSQYGYRATLYPIIERLSQPGYLTLAQVRMLRDLHGWEVGAHSVTTASHRSLTVLTPAEIEAELSAIREWQDAQGIQSDSYAYPVGNYSGDAISIVQKYFSSARSNYAQMTTPDTNQPYRLGALVLGKAANGTLARAKAKIDLVAANGAWLPLVIHDLVASGGTTNDWTIADFNELVDYIASKGMSVATVGEVIYSQ